jgi:hypothetical protein
MGLSWNLGEPEDDAVSGVADISSLEASPGWEDVSRVGEAVTLRKIADSEGGDGVGDDSRLERSVELEGKSRREGCITLEDILSGENKLIGEYEGALTLEDASATEPRVCTMIRVEWIWEKE